MSGNKKNNCLFSIVVPVFNNKEILPLCFPSVAQLLRNENVSEILVVDDCSTDSTPDWILKNYPEVKLIRNEKNLGFGKTCYNGIKQAKSDWIILLNSDIKIESDIIAPLIDSVNRNIDLFTVSFYSFNEKGERFEGRKLFMPKTGLYKTRNNYTGDYINGRLYETFYSCGGHCLLSKEKFLLLNGFSTVFEPFYWEDADLSYRAMKRGWKVLFDPRCKVTHCHKGSIRSSNSARLISMIQTRNKMLFFWKNVSSPLLWIYHISGMSFRVLTSWIAGDFIFYSALIRALARLPDVYSEYSYESKFWKIKDSVLFRTGRGNNKSGSF